MFPRGYAVDLLHPIFFLPLLLLQRSVILFRACFSGIVLFREMVALPTQNEENPRNNNYGFPFSSFRPLLYFPAERLSCPPSLLPP